MLAAGQQRPARSQDKVPDRAGDEHLPGLAQRRYPGRHVHGHSSHGAVDADHLTAVQPCPDLGPMLVQVLADGHRAGDRPAGQVERRQEAVTRGVNLYTVVPFQQAADLLVVLVEQLTPAPIP